MEQFPSDGQGPHNFNCGDGQALVSYIYEECGGDERAAIDAHLLTCASCAEEVAGLRGTRVQLSAWTPPAVDLGFRVTSAADATEAPEPARILRPARWWSRPLPAWAQVAAAAVIFSAGIALGRGQSAPGPQPQTASTTQAASTVQPAPAMVGPGDVVSHDELDAVERRLVSEIARVRESGSSRAVLASAPQPPKDEIFNQVRALIADSERRQRQVVDARTADVATELDDRWRIAFDQMQVQNSGVTVLGQGQVPLRRVGFKR